LYNNSYKTGFE
jgi:hypothetical protein